MSAPGMLDQRESGQPSDIASVDRLLSAPAFAALIERHGRTPVTVALREHLTSLRHAALAGSLARSSLPEAVIAAAVEARLAETARAALRPVSISPAPCCTPTSAARSCPRRRYAPSLKRSPRP